MTIINLLDKINGNSDVTYIVIRAIIIYIFAIVLLRIGNKRFQMNTPLDFIFIIMLGGILGRGIYGDITLSATLISCLVIKSLNWLFAILTFHSNTVEKILKGSSHILMKNNKIQRRALMVNQITPADIDEECRKALNTTNMENVKEIRLERTGAISFVLHDKK